MHKYRKATVAGMFYPDSCSEIKQYIAHFDKEMPELTLDIVPRALIVPHAGYITVAIPPTLPTTIPLQNAPT